MKKYIYSGIIVLLFMSCSSSKLKMNGFKYDVKYEKITRWELVHGPKSEFKEPGNFDTFEWVEEGDSLPVILTIKRLYYKDQQVLGCEIKGQRHTFEHKKDTVFLEGEMFVFDDLVICVRQGKHSFRDNDKLIQIAQQKEDGGFEFKKSVRIEP